MHQTILQENIPFPNFPSLLQAEQALISQPFLTGEVFHPVDHFCGPPLDLLQEVHVFPVLRVPGWVSPEWSRGAESPPSTLLKIEQLSSTVFKKNILESFGQYVLLF